MEAPRPNRAGAAISRWCVKLERSRRRDLSKVLQTEPALLKLESSCAKSPVEMRNARRHIPTMAILETALALLRRPVAEPGETQPVKRRGKTDAAAPEAAPLTELELIAALEGLAAERADAQHVLAGASERRETLLMQPDSDDAILDLGNQIDRAQLQLERLDRLEPDLRRRLGEVRFHGKNARWIADRDAAAAKFEGFIAAIDAYNAARSEWAAVWNGLLEQWPTANEIMPWMPGLVSSLDVYQEQLAKFRELVFVVKPPPRPFGYTLAQAVDHTRQLGHPPDWAVPDWHAECERAISDNVAVVTIVNTLDPEGRPVPKNTTLELSYESADKMVRSGRATYL